MLKSLRIKNFQKHASYKLKFDPHVTTIVGPSDVGKSAILRAIIWAVLNKPRGASFLRTGADTVSVTLKLKGHKITRSRGKTNTYHLDGHKFAAFGHDVPTEISTVLKLNETINFQGQHDSSFWFSQSPGEVSRQLNRIIDLSVIDTTLTNIAGEIRKSRVEHGIVEGRLETARLDREKLRSAKKADRELKTVEEADAHSTKLRKRCSSLKRLLERAIGHRDVADRSLRRLAAARKTLELGAAWRKRQSANFRLDHLVLCIKREEQHTKAKIPKLKRFQNLANDWVDLGVRSAILTCRISEIHRLTELRNVARIKINLAKVQLTKFEVCPFCENPIKKEVWKAIKLAKYEEVYEISTHGHVRSVDRKTHGFVKGQPMKESPWTDGYLALQMRYGGKKKTVGIHRLSLLTFVGPPPTPEHEANHKDGIKTNNHISNLEWATPSENSQHAVDTGLRKYESK